MSDTTIIIIIVVLVVIAAVAAFFIWRMCSKKKDRSGDYVNPERLNTGSRENRTLPRTNTGGTNNFGTARGITEKKLPTAAPAVDPSDTLFPELKQYRIDHNEVLLTRAISRGAFGVVWLGHYHGQPVAIKRMIEGDDEAVSFSKEIQTMGRLSHPKIVQFIGATWTSGYDLSAVTEFMDGGDVRGLLENQKINLTWKNQKIGIAIDVAEALAYLHGLTPKLIHRDLKSKNVMLTANMVAKLSDFGLSRNRSYEETLTAGVGTVRWTAPEVMLGDIYSEMADVYSFGVVLSELDTREIPFEDQKSSKAGGAPDMSIVVKVARGELRPSFSPTCPPSILQVAKACLQFDPALRPSSARLVEMLHKAKLEFTLAEDE
ncbi:kinase [Thraustotheca clavata]|uniref:Kinase n=1 Tax=Thraustotheca clavata TaxID=74557 RepID=A0A1V9ZXE0_9STRA|nr:kinase [Thraustotheca clavata]